MSRFGARALRHRQRETFGFAVGDLVDHAGGFPVSGRVAALVNYGRVAHVFWPNGIVGSHPVTALTPHVEGA